VRMEDNGTSSEQCPTAGYQLAVPKLPVYLMQCHLRLILCAMNTDAILFLTEFSSLIFQIRCRPPLH
jgi:hypothetical protein